MSGAERQRNRRARVKVQSFNVTDLVTEIVERMPSVWNDENKRDWEQLIAQLIEEMGTTGFSKTLADEHWEVTVTVTVTERELNRDAASYNTERNTVTGTVTEPELRS